MALTIKRNTDKESWPEKGAYRVWVRPNDGRQIPNLCCPKCGEVASMASHTVADDGSVTPSAICPNNDCDFHEYIKLDDWRP
jgi:hypothetical protein